MAQLTRQQEPLNTEPYSKELVSSYITPNELVFNRNHDSVLSTAAPDSTVTDWTVGVYVDDDDDDDDDGTLHQFHVSRPSLSLESLKKDHDLSEVVATLECAGNRRAELSASHQPAEGIQWGNAVIANVVWGGASLRSVLLAAGLPDPFAHHSDLATLEPSADAYLRDAAEWARPLHLHMYSAQESSESDDPTRKEYFAASIPLATAMHPNQHCLLAYEYNRTPLTQRHGAPLRAVIPGHVGARWVKWLNGLKLSMRENDSPPMRQDYKLLVPDTQTEQGYAEKARNDSEFRKEQLQKHKPLQRLEASCSITQPSQDGMAVRADAQGTIQVKGYAVGQDGSPATHVYVAAIPEGEGTTQDVLDSLPADIEWKQAEIKTQVTTEAASTKWSWAWTLWHVDLTVPEPNQHWILVARCVTASGIHQEKISDWNLRGFHNRSWSVVRHLEIQS